MTAPKKMDKFTNTPKEIDNYVEILEKQLYFAVLKGSKSVRLKNSVDTFFFSIDDELIYQNYYNDFGPLNLSCLYKYCCKLNKFLQYSKNSKSVVHYTCSHPEKKTNAACLLGCYCIIYLDLSPKEIWKVLLELGSYKPFSDASQYPNAFNLRIIDILQAVSKAKTFNFFDFNDFNVSEYDLYDKLQYGDMNWLVPRKFLAFIGPADNGSAHPPEFYIRYFLKNDIKTVIRLNAAAYDATVFTQVGIHHFDLVFPDGATPPRDILLRFLTIAETAPAGIAVHCKAGLGRTGSLIGAYLIKHYRMTARESIGWMRLCRPGSVISQQQLWLEKIESWLWRTGSQYRVRKYGAGDKIPKHRYGIYSKEWPLEREKIINETRTKLQTVFTKSQWEKVMKNRRNSVSMDSLSKAIKQQKSVKKMLPSDNLGYKSVSKMLLSIHAGNRNINPPNIKAKSGIILPPKSRMEEHKMETIDKVNSMFMNQYTSNNENRTQFRNLTQGDKLNEKKIYWHSSRNFPRNTSTKVNN